jgi:tRNA dimethylallyltransferase
LFVTESMSDDSPTPLVCITGPTASGKSSLALAVAEQLPAEILCVDSMQVYRGFDVGTAKPNASEQARVLHHGIDLVDPHDQYDAGTFLTYAREVVAARRALGSEVLAVGGTGLYLRGLIHGLAPSAPADAQLREELREAERLSPGSLMHRLEAVDPSSAKALHPNDLVRVERALEVFLLTGRPQSVWWAEHGFGESLFEPLLFAIRWSRQQLRERIAQRVIHMLEAGWLQEVAALVDQGVTDDAPAMRALGYRQLREVLADRVTLDEATMRITVLCQQFAKRQSTWFNRVPSIHWLDPDEDMVTSVVEHSRKFLGRSRPRRSSENG